MFLLPNLGFSMSQLIGELKLVVALTAPVLTIDSCLWVYYMQNSHTFIDLSLCSLYGSELYILFQ